MRILIANESYFPNVSGTVIFSQNLAEELVRRGHSVALFVPSSNGFYRHERRGGIDVYRFPSLPNPLRKKGRFVMRQHRKIVAAFEEYGPDVVHLQAPLGIAASVQRCALKRYIPIIATNHFMLDFILAYIKPIAFILPTVTNKALATYLNRFYRQCDYVTCPTESIRQSLIRDGIKVPLHVVSNGIRIDHFADTNKPVVTGVPTDRPIILSVGRLDRDKNIPVLMDVIAKTVALEPVRFVIVGSGNRLAYAKRYARQRGLGDSVIFTGRMPHDSAALVTLYHQASAFVMISNIETQSLVTMEAMAASLPVVGSKEGAIPELVHDGENGYLVDADDSEMYAEKLVLIVRDPDLRTRLGNQGRALIEEHCLTRVIDHYINLYQGSI